MWKEINYKEDSNNLLVPNINYQINPAEIESIEKNSIAEEIGFESGDSIISINGKKPRDLIDYQILISEEILEIAVLDKNKKNVFAFLSARVGSISDNKIGGWYSYRASKTALNQIIKNFSIEVKRSNPNFIIYNVRITVRITRMIH